jgi:hypothetical protein
MDEFLFKKPKNGVRFFHFNDVYELEDNPKREISSGIPRFTTALN